MKRERERERERESWRLLGNGEIGGGDHLSFICSLRQSSRRHSKTVWSKDSGGLSDCILFLSSGGVLGSTGPEL
jgi:hypothetical protein